MRGGWDKIKIIVKINQLQEWCGAWKSSIADELVVLASLRKFT